MHAYICVHMPAFAHQKFHVLLLLPGYNASHDMRRPRYQRLLVNPVRVWWLRQRVLLKWWLLLVTTIHKRLLFRWWWLFNTWYESLTVRTNIILSIKSVAITFSRSVLIIILKQFPKSLVLAPCFLSQRNAKHGKIRINRCHHNIWQMWVHCCRMTKFDHLFNELLLCPWNTPHLRLKRY